MISTAKPRSARNAVRTDMDNSRPIDDARRELHKTFGFTDFRQGQAEVVEKLLAGKSTVAIFPTGGGKSLCYQLPALMLDGLTVVVSPLIALMKDQIDFLVEHQVPAARLDSSLDREAALRTYDELRAGRTKLLYVSPERLGNERFLQLLEQQRIGLLAIDEAHCISQWGHNFRPDYLKIAALARQLNVERVLALTATATPEVTADIAAAFEIAAEDVVQTGFYRPNLELRVTACRDEERAKLLVSRLKSRPVGPTIVYVTLQKTASQIASYLAKCGFDARAYHAGLAADERNEIQDVFMASNEMIVVATIAFGMGIDKSNIRAVYHYNLPKGLESYMQEIGRAGRDGEHSVCEMLASADDVVTLENFSYGDTPDRESIAAITDELLGMGPEFDVSIFELAQRHDVRDLVVKTLITYLELDGVVQSTGSCYAQFRFQPQRPSVEILAQFDPDRAEFLRNVLKCAKLGKTWFTLDADLASRQLKEPRQRIVAALNYLEEKGDLIVEATGARQKYRRLRLPEDRAEAVAELAERFLEREANDVARVESVVAMAEHDGCLWNFLLEYFGESRDACGHCGGCSGDLADRLQRPSPWSPSADDVATVRQLRGERIAALAKPRQLARFLCGISSPAATRAKLRQRKEFGLWNHRPFADVLALAERG